MPKQPGDNSFQDRGARTFRTIMVEPFKQIKLGVYVIAIALTFTVITGALFVFAFIEQYQHLMEIFQVIDPKFKWEVVTNDIFRSNVIRLAVVLVSFIAILFLVVFRYTHKYYGPLVSIERFVDEIAEGDYTKRVVIRRGDELQRFVEKLNTMADRLELRHGVVVDRRRTSGPDDPQKDAP